MVQVENWDSESNAGGVRETYGVEWAHRSRVAHTDSDGVLPDVWLTCEVHRLQVKDVGHQLSESVTMVYRGGRQAPLSVLVESGLHRRRLT